jgi:hypothetical protein
MTDEERFAGARPLSAVGSGDTKTLNVEEVRFKLVELEGELVVGVLTYADVASVFRVSEQTVMKWVKLGRIPPPIYYGASARFNSQQIRQVQRTGLSPAGTYTPPISMRSRIGKLGAAAKEDLRLAEVAKTKKKPTKKRKPPGGK